MIGQVGTSITIMDDDMDPSVDRGEGV